MEKQQQSNGFPQKPKYNNYWIGQGMYN